MTTPERFRRRQQIEGALLVALGVFTILISGYFRSEDIAQRECFANRFSELTEVLEHRGESNDAQFKAIDRVIAGALQASTPAEVLAARERYYADVRRIEARREGNPIPPFPEGTCE